MNSPGGMFIEDVDPELFHGKFLSISRVDCITMDPQQCQMLEVAYECLENAGVPLELLSGFKTGVIVGTNFLDYTAILNRDPEDRADSITIGLASSILINRVSHFLNVTGPSLVSVDVACRYLDSFQADGMIVGGANTWLTREHNEEGGHDKHYTRLDDAIRNKDPIRAIIRGTAAIMAYKNAGISDFWATQFLECHGTGTLAGDPVEVKGAASVFAAGRQPGQDLVIGSIKSNIGHSEAAARLSILLKAIMAVEHAVITGNQIDVVENATGLHHESSYTQVTTNFFDDDDDEDDKESELVNSEKANDTIAPKLLVFSANDQGSLQSYVQCLSSHLLNPMVSIDQEDLAYTLLERRTKHYYRAFALTRPNKVNISLDSLVQGKQASSPRAWASCSPARAHSESVIQGLDEVLQTLPEPPKWSLLVVFTEDRSAKALSQPEFSQPLTTGVSAPRPSSVIPGEIAAAAAAGLISPATAIKTAYFCGQAAKKVEPSPEPVGMLAVGVGADVLRDGLKEGGHFARLLLVELAYHSDYMTEIGVVYEEMLIGNGVLDESHAADNKQLSEKPPFSSSATGKALSASESPNVTYWKRSMVSVVQFDQAATEFRRDTKDGTDFLLELGPSKALSGPIAQIKKKLASSSGADATYNSALERGADSTLAMYKAAGQTFLAGGSVNLCKVNRVSSNKAKFTVDLPNYSWNHSTRYWHETLASKDWRFKKFINHDLLGSKVLDTAWQAHVFRKVLKLADLTWLKDHKMGSEVVFPAAGYVAMPVVAVYQTAMTASPALWKGDLPSADAAALLPKIIDSIVIEAGSSRHLPTEGIALASANYLGVGDTENPCNYATSVELYDPKDGKFLFEMMGLASGVIETGDQETAGHTVMLVEWNADQWLETKTVQEVLGIVAHKRPGLSVLELNLGSVDDSSLWLEQTTAWYICRAHKAEKKGKPTNAILVANAASVLDALAAKKLVLESPDNPLAATASNTDVVVVVDELSVSLADRSDEQQSGNLKHIITKERVPILWVTSGAHLTVTDPTKAAITGLFRTIRAEQELLLVTLDIESPGGDAAADAILACFKELRSPFGS
ncbi:hypothetical protein LX32DRAFT_648230 [Colletotrichum zoysiae]|uniref:Beta-ketoacyl synthase domain-containing protein n=1 Tax=Colletotrichum zoysiae TaxID=1216348 RepID=A0AAD9HTL2_9PEZI|nr:hypothetical protein LX32DRAFT_648230 [Colletotrichum zoysiae]